MTESATRSSGLERPAILDAIESDADLGVGRAFAEVIAGYLAETRNRETRPAVVPVVALVPPAVEDAAGSAIPLTRGLHAAACREASSGRRGLFSQTSTPWTICRATPCRSPR